MKLTLLAPLATLALVAAPALAANAPAKPVAAKHAPAKVAKKTVTKTVKTN